MSDDAPDRLELLFREALGVSPAERVAFLESTCADDPDLRAELTDLLASSEVVEAEGFLAEPLLGPTLAAPADTADLIGETVGPYRIVRRLGRGGMGDVYLAERETPFKREVALKLMRERIGRRARQSFGREQQVLASLRHPHIARLLDGGVTEDGRPYFAMELVEGQSLTDYADTHRLSLDARLRLFGEVCGAVHHAHTNFVLHRDLKPSNILVADDGTPKLLDFGIARLLDPARIAPATATQTVRRALTPEYASPEQIRNLPLSTTSDVYSLGVVLYELLTGRRPYRLSRDRPDEVIETVCRRVPVRPSDAVQRADRTAGSDAGPSVAEARATTPDRLRRALGGDLDAIVMKALRKEPEQRYGSAAELLQDLDRYRERHPVLARRGGRRYRLGRFLRRRRVEVVASSIVLLALGGGAGVALWQASVARANEAAARTALAESEAIRTFMTDLFRDSGPMEAQALTPTTERLLQRGVERAEALVDQPLIKAGIFATIGQVYMSLVEYDLALGLFERSHALRRAELPSAHLDLAESLALLGEAHVRLGRYERARKLFQQAQTIQASHPDAPISARLGVIRHLGDLYTRLDDLQRAERAYRDALQLSDKLESGEPLALADDQRRLGATLVRMGRWDEALPYYRSAAELTESVFGEKHPRTAQARFHLADQLLRMEREDQAAILFEDGIRVMQAAYDSTHPWIAHGLHSLARIHVRHSQFEEAEALYRESVAMARRLYGEDNPNYANVMNLLGGFLLDRGRLDEAEALHIEALRIVERRFEPSHRGVLAGRVPFANLFVARGDFAKAEALNREILALRIGQEGASSLLVAGDLERLADVLLLQQRADEAEALYLDAMAIRDVHQADAHGAKQRIFLALVGIYERRGDEEAAARFRARVLPRFLHRPLPI